MDAQSSIGRRIIQSELRGRVEKEAVGLRAETDDGFSLRLDRHLICFVDVGRVLEPADGGRVDVFHWEIGVKGLLEIEGGGTRVVNPPCDVQCGAKFEDQFEAEFVGP